MSRARARPSGGRLLRAFVRGAPLWCSWQLTRRCSSLCLFCENRPAAAEEELETDACLRIAAELSRIGTMFVSLSGGEPFLRSDLERIVGALAADHVPLLTTHGWLVEEARARELWGAGLVAATVLLEGPAPEEHDARIGVRGAHARAMESVRVLASQRVDPGVQYVNVKVRVRDPGDVPRVEELAAEASALGASLGVEPAFPVAQGSAAGLGRELLQLKRRQAGLRSSVSYLSRFDAARADGVAGCRAGRTFFNVDHRGQVSKCVEWTGPEHRAGDLSRQEAPVVLARLRELTAANDCRQCWSAARGEMESLFTVRGFGAALGTLWRR